MGEGIGRGQGGMRASQKVGYAIGDLAIAVRNAAVLNFLLFFYTNVVLLDAWLAGLALAIGRVWDGFNDPLVGYLSDRTRSRYGRRRPYLLAAALPLALSFWLLFRPPAGLEAMGAFLFLTITYVLLDAFFTLYATPYFALGAELTRDYHERTELVAIRALFHGLGALVTVVVLGWAAGGQSPTIGTATKLPSPEWMRGAFATGAGLLAILMTGSGLVTFAACREIPAAHPSGQLSFRAFLRDLVSTLRNRPFRVVLATFVVMTFGGAMNQPLAVYVFRDWLGVRDDLPVVMLLYLVASTLSLAFWAWLSRRIGKNRAFELCILWIVVLLGLFPLLGPETPRPLFLAFMAAAGFGVGGYMLPTSIAADVIDHDELETGVRREGAFFGLWTLAMKLASALAIAFVGFSLDAIGYVPNEAQSEGTLLALRLLYGPVPALFLLASLILFRRFPLTRESHAEIRRALDALTVT